MDITVLEKISADLHALNKGLDRLNDTMQVMAVAAYSGSLMAARIQSAKTEYERNEAVKVASSILLDIEAKLAGGKKDA